MNTVHKKKRSYDRSGCNSRELLIRRCLSFFREWLVGISGLCIIYLFFQLVASKPRYLLTSILLLPRGRVSAEKLAGFLDMQHRMSFLSYVLVPVSLAIRMTLVAFWFAHRCCLPPETIL